MVILWTNLISNLFDIRLLKFNLNFCNKEIFLLICWYYRYIRKTNTKLSISWWKLKMLNVSAAFVEVLENCCQGLHWENTIKTRLIPRLLQVPWVLDIAITLPLSLTTPQLRGQKNTAWIFRKGPKNINTREGHMVKIWTKVSVWPTWTSNYGKLNLQCIG